VARKIELGLKENSFQFTLLVIVNAFVGAMVGLERTLLPEIAEKDFGMVAKTAILSFIVVFGLSKAFTNYFAGRFSDKYGRKIVLIVGWLFAIPVPFLLMKAPSWNWILVANLFLGVSQGLTWSTTVIMKFDLVGSKERGLAMGLNEFAGYFAVAMSALATGYIASHYGYRPQPFYLGVVYIIAGAVLSIFFVRETRDHVTHEIKINEGVKENKYSQKELFLLTSFKDKNLSSITQAGFINNLNDGMAWGIFPMLYASLNFDLKTIGILAAIYPASWGLLQIFTGYYSDKVGRKYPIVLGMWIQALGIICIAMFNSFWPFVMGNLFLGIGTAMVYPTLLAAIGDVAHPSWRASSVGIYRLWRDSGYAAGAIIAGVTADYFGIRVAIWLVAIITFISGVVVLLRMRETLVKNDSVSVLDISKLSSAVFIDVRSLEEFRNGHIPSAIHAPKEIILNVVQSIPKKTITVINCGKGGGRSIEAMKLLREHGWENAYWLEGGYQAYIKHSQNK
jgi:MFS family permease